MLVFTTKCLEHLHVYESTMMEDLVVVRKTKVGLLTDLW